MFIECVFQDSMQSKEGIDFIIFFYVFKQLYEQKFSSQNKDFFKQQICLNQYIRGHVSIFLIFFLALRKIFKNCKLQNNIARPEIIDAKYSGTIYIDVI